MQTPLGSLVVFELDGSHSGVWPQLAREVGVDLRCLTSIDAFRESVARESVARAGIVAGSTDSERLDDSIREIQTAPMEIAAVTSSGDHRTAVRLCRAGASDVFVLPQDYAPLRDWVSTQTRVSATAAAERPSDPFGAIVGESAVLRNALREAARVVSHGNATVLLTGESGTGKMLLARALHDAGPRAAGPFVDVDCAAIPEHRFDGELFGREPGAFADRTNEPGLVDAARGGTLLLRAVDRLPPRVQGKLVRLLGDRTIRRDGGTVDLRVDLRVVATTQADLARAVRRGEFRRDLYSRLGIVTIALPPLRARADDILPIARQLVIEFARQYNLRGARLTPGAERVLRNHGWPGNVRELRDAIERAVLLAPNAEISASILRPTVDQVSIAEGARLEQLNTIIRRTVVETVDVCGGNKSDAARRLGISRTRLQRLLRTGPRNRSSEHLAERADD